MLGLAFDLRHAVRGLIRAPGFTAVAVFALAIGAGSATIGSMIRIDLDRYHGGTPRPGPARMHANARTAGDDYTGGERLSPPVRALRARRPSSGTSMVKVVPISGRLSTAMLPPCA